MFSETIKGILKSNIPALLLEIDQLSRLTDNDKIYANTSNRPHMFTSPKIILDSSLASCYQHPSTCDLYFFTFLFKKLKTEISVYLGLARDFIS